MTLWIVVTYALLFVLLLAGLSSVIRRVTVYEYQHALRFKRGKLTGVLSPGTYWMVKPITSVQILEARPQIITIPGQEVLSADGVSLRVSLLLEVRVVDPKAATLETASYEQSLYAKAQAALRVSIGERPIEEILQSRSELAARLHSDVESDARALGLELQSISIKDIMFPGPLKEAFSQKARAQQEAHAALERARGETAALRNLANASKMLENNPNLFQLRVLQAVSQAGKVVVNLPPADPGSSEPSV